jgi:phosphoenolpyruvate carboxylase
MKTLKNMNRKIPSTMASQHPDHAGKPYWHNKEYITAQHEHKECFLMYSDLGIQEYKWDWEGKIVDESIMERLLNQYYDYFKNNPLGKEKFLTFRLPNPKAETEFRLARAFMGILSAAALTRQVGMHSPPLFEVILPMTETADEMIAIQEAFQEITELKHVLYRFENNSLKNIEVIPLFEQVSTIMNSDQIIKDYITLHIKKFKEVPSYLRPYVARSDPALNSSIVPTVLAIKIALSRYKRFTQETGIPLYPVIGSASLPFRGGLTPHTVDQFTNEYRGIKTALIQSAFRYDYDKEDVKKAIQTLNDNLPVGIARDVTAQEEKELKTILPFFELPYRSVIEEIAPLINKIASQLPARRERVQHIGLFGYSRGVGKVTLPRAITFTGSLYSIGVPPELIGTGRGIQQTIAAGKIELLEKFYINLKQDLIRSGKFLNKKLLNELAGQYPAFKDVEMDIKYIENYIGTELGPENTEEKEHYGLTEKIYTGFTQEKIPHEFLVRAAVLRKSMG